VTVPPPPASYQGHYAGSVSRFAAYAIDLAASSAVFSLALAGISYAVHIVTGNAVSWNRSNIVVAVIFVVWEFVYFGYSWAVSGRTFGMAALGIRVVAADGSVLEPRRGVVRALVFPLSFLLFGLGFLGILVQREHRALHDLIAGSAVIYAWDARAARLRFLARQAELAPAALPHSAGVTMPPTDQPLCSLNGTEARSGVPRYCDPGVLRGRRGHADVRLQVGRRQRRGGCGGHRSRRSLLLTPGRPLTPATVAAGPGERVTRNE
jgi:uncharacterized RDD family membrane protein YckC